MKIQEIEKAQEKWGKGIVKIGELKDSLKECRMFTIDFINKMYDYEKKCLYIIGTFFLWIL